MRLRIEAQTTARRLLPGAARLARLSRRAWLTLATATVLFAYAALLLWPYEWEPAGYVENQAQSLPEGGIRFAGPGIARTPAPPEWVAAAMRARELEVQLEVRPLQAKQTGPARIMTLSLDHRHRDFTIAQEGAHLILRLRTPASSLNGTVDDAPVARVPDVFRSMRWVTLRLRIESGQLVLSVNGEVVARRSLPADPFENWDPSYSLALGNELTNSRPWLGEIRRAVVRAGDIEVDYARSSELETPKKFWLFPSTPRLIPFQYLIPRDLILNVILFIPLGVLIGAWRGRRAGRVGRAILLLAAISAGFEMLQLFVPGRVTSIDDVIANTLGGALGVLLVLWLSAPAASAAARADV
ncbi:MAG TPA: VanZ family protein [Geminicoccaceae bacterium]|nr:VanZ family protein [Geminicoccaceae bacterium]